jgi:hypothetical protein
MVEERGQARGCGKIGMLIAIAIVVAVIVLVTTIIRTSDHVQPPNAADIRPKPSEQGMHRGTD